MSLLARINQPADLRGLSHPELVRLAGEIRDILVRHVAATGGHLTSGTRRTSTRS